MIPTVPFSEARKLYLERIAELPTSKLDMWHVKVADAVLHMAYTLDGTLVQEILEPEGDGSLGYVPIPRDIEHGITVVLMSTIDTPEST